MARPDGARRRSNGGEAMIRSYGVKQAIENQTPVQRHAEEIRLAGYTIVRQVVDPRLLATLRTRLDRLYEIQASAHGGIECLRAINDANVVRCPLAQDELFLELATSRRIVELANELLGDAITLQQQNGVINPANDDNYQSGWHRDLPYQHFVSSRPLAISALVCLDPFTEQTGGTVVLPASHLAEPFPSREYVLAHERGVVGEPGDVLMFDSMLFHRAGCNRSGRPRRAVNHVYSLPFIKQPISLPRALGGKHGDDPTLRRLLGYETEPADNAFDWRDRRLARIKD
jgi:ectoine hydroxylase-related dioxygenase (phytanoyl-CoA dioxygenase family)